MRTIESLIRIPCVTRYKYPSLRRVWSGNIYSSCSNFSSFRSCSPTYLPYIVYPLRPSVELTKQNQHSERTFSSSTTKRSHQHPAWGLPGSPDHDYRAHATITLARGKFSSSRVVSRIIDTKTPLYIPFELRTGDQLQRFFEA